MNLFTTWNIKTRSLNFSEWLVNYSRLLKSNYQWYSGNKFFCLALKNKFKKCKHIYNKVSIISKQLSSDETFTSLISMPSLSLTHIPLFSITISVAAVIKTIKYSTYYIIHNSYDVATKYPIIKKLVKSLHINWLCCKT